SSPSCCAASGSVNGSMRPTRCVTPSGSAPATTGPRDWTMALEVVLAAEVATDGSVNSPTFWTSIATVTPKADANSAKPPRLFIAPAVDARAGTLKATEGSPLESDHRLDTPQPLP